MSLVVILVLAGTMGQHYAQKSGESDAVANAVFESVLPRQADDILPTTEEGVLLSVADRLDSLVSTTIQSAT